MVPNVICLLQKIFRDLSESYIEKYKPNYLDSDIIFNITHCNTNFFGTTYTKCINPKCNNKTFFHGLCHDRHCPICQYLRRMKWVYDLYEKLLPVDHLHKTFIMPFQLNSLAFSNKKQVYDCLFYSINKALNSYAKKHYKGKIGFSAQLHSWGDPMTYHVHIHVIIPNGYFSSGNKWIDANGFELFNEKAITDDFKANMIRRLKLLQKRNRLTINENIDFDSLIEQLTSLDWRVHTKLVKKNNLLKLVNYLGKYAYGVGITKNRVIGFDSNQVTITYRDKNNSDLSKQMTLSGLEFIRRFLLHRIPKAFHKIRHYGFMSSKHQDILLKCHELLGTKKTKFKKHTILEIARMLKFNIFICEKCNSLMEIYKVEPKQTKCLFLNRK